MYFHNLLQGKTCALYVRTRDTVLAPYSIAHWTLVVNNQFSLAIAKCVFALIPYFCILGSDYLNFADNGIIIKWLINIYSWMLIHVFATVKYHTCNSKRQRQLESSLQIVRDSKCSCQSKEGYPSSSISSVTTPKVNLKGLLTCWTYLTMLWVQKMKRTSHFIWLRF